MQNIKKSINALLFLLLIFSSCKEKEKKEEQEFDKKSILTNLADNWIIPGYLELKNKVSEFENAWINFKNNGGQAEFDELKIAWKETYFSFQKVKFIDFGPASENGLTMI